MKYVRLIKEWIDGMLLCVPSVNKRYVARKMRNKDKLPLSHGWFPISMDDIERAITEYANHLFDHNRLVIDIVYCHQRYLTSPNEYFHSMQLLIMRHQEGMWLLWTPRRA